MESTYIAIVLAMIFGTFLLDNIARLFNLKALSTELPEEFADVYDAKAYKESQEYTVVTTQFSMIRSAVSLGVVLLFWFFGGFAQLDEYLRGWDFPFPVTGILYIGALVFAHEILFLPFDIYRTFVIENRFGFNRTTAKTFMLDLLKSTILVVLLGSLFLGVVLAGFQYGGEYAWFLAWIAVTAVLLFSMLLIPQLIMPLFFKFTPLKDGVLKNSIMELADKLHFPIGDIYVVDGSRRSTHANAFFMGFGRYKRIALFDTLIEKQGVSEIVGILGHEIGHYKKKHVMTMMIFTSVYWGIALFALSFFLDVQAFFSAFGVETPSVYVGLALFTLMASLPKRLISIFGNIISRHNERQADTFAVHALHNPDALISGLKNLSSNSRSNLTPHPFFAFINYSHPPMQDRIASLRAVRCTDGCLNTSKV